MPQTQTTISITSPKITVIASPGGKIQCVPVEPEEMVTRTITIDSLTVQQFAGRCCDLAGFPLMVNGTEIDDPNNPGQKIAGPQVPNPADCALPSLQRTVEYWLGEAGFKAREIAEEQHNAAVAATAAANMGAGVTAMT